MRRPDSRRPHRSPTEQRAWLNGFVAGLLGAERALASARPSAAAVRRRRAAAEIFPWHDPTLALDERMKLAEGAAAAASSWRRWASSIAASAAIECRSYAAAIAERQREAISASACPAAARRRRS